MARKHREPVSLDDDSDLIEPSGVVLARGVVEGKAVSWKAPPIIRERSATGHKGKRRVAHWDRDYKRFTGWIAEVKLQAEPCTIGRRGVYGGPVKLRVVFYVHCQREQWEPDTTNLVKAFEDALQGVVYANDRQVKETHARKITDKSEAERVEFEVTAL
jgi:Holliday junction resolvase RusA-like endonuclease